MSTTFTSPFECTCTCTWQWVSVQAYTSGLETCRFKRPDRVSEYKEHCWAPPAAHRVLAVANVVISAAKYQVPAGASGNRSVESAASQHTGDATAVVGSAHDHLESVWRELVRTPLKKVRVTHGGEKYEYHFTSVPSIILTVRMRSKWHSSPSHAKVDCNCTSVGQEHFPPAVRGPHNCVYRLEVVERGVNLPLSMFVCAVSNLLDSSEWSPVNTNVLPLFKKDALSPVLHKGYVSPMYPTVPKLVLGYWSRHCGLMLVLSKILLADSPWRHSTFPRDCCVSKPVLLVLIGIDIDGYWY